MLVAQKGTKAKLPREPVMARAALQPRSSHPLLPARCMEDGDARSGRKTPSWMWCAKEVWGSNGRALLQQQLLQEQPPPLQCPHPARSPELVPVLREQEPGLSAHSCGHVESRAVRNGIWGMQMEVCQAFCTLAN